MNAFCKRKVLVFPEITKIPKNFGNKIKKCRKDLGWTQQNLSAASGIAEGDISRIERGLITPSLETAILLVWGLEVDPAVFFGSCGFKSNEMKIKAIKKLSGK